MKGLRQYRLEVAVSNPARQHQGLSFVMIVPARSKKQAQTLVARYFGGIVMRIELYK